MPKCSECNHELGDRFYYSVGDEEVICAKCYGEER